MGYDVCYWEVVLEYLTKLFAFGTFSISCLICESRYQESFLSVAGTSTKLGATQVSGNICEDVQCRKPDHVRVIRL